LVISSMVAAFVVLGAFFVFLRVST